ncbi:hypothetical protein SDC9_141042 [bioreactor metagenome]|uniref:Uncharacterized protein n=2 Tax=root TaxID=1 RepID=A0A645DWK4_9ZZZZ
MNTNMKAVPHPTVKDIGQSPVLSRIESSIKNNVLKFEIDTKQFDITKLNLYSPELGDQSREIHLSRARGKTILEVDLTGIRVYAVAQ